MASSAQARNKEKARIKAGMMEGVGRLVFYNPAGDVDDANRWYHLDMKDLAAAPLGVEATIRLTKKTRQTNLPFSAKDPDVGIFNAFLFCRVESGKKPRENPSFYPHVSKVALL